MYKVVEKLFFRILKRLPYFRSWLVKVETHHGINLLRLGSAYGGWTFVDTTGLKGSTIISAGLGEDATFDIEFARKYQANVILIDPTPRAIAHFNEIQMRLGAENQRDYESRSGKQPIDAYNLSGLERAQLRLIPKALWKSGGIMKFFEPSDPQHVSHSLVNFQNDYSNDTDCIEVECVTLSEIVSKTDAHEIEVLKLDIEGAEIEVIEQFSKHEIRPNQILIEYDELNELSTLSTKRIKMAHRILNSLGYRCVYHDNKTNFLYVKNEILL